MRNKKTCLRAAAVLLAGALLVPAAALARGGGFSHGGHGPVFGLHHRPIVAHRPFRPGLQHSSLHFAAWWRLHRFARHRGDNLNGTGYGYGYGDGSYPASAYDPGDVTGTLAPPPAVFAPPGGTSAERVGCFSRGYEVPGESGGVARVTVTRC
jgi:hypothetical protein